MDEAGPGTGAETTNGKENEERTEAAEAAEATETRTEAARDEVPAGEAHDEESAVEHSAEAAEVPAEDGSEEAVTEGPSGVGQGAGAVVSAGLGIVSLTGGWISGVASARETLVGQLHTSTSSASVAEQIKMVYGNAWQATALWGGLFALAALLVGAVVLVRPVFGAPGKPQVPWVKSVAWGGMALGAVGLVLAVLKYTDVLLGLPSVG
ncbi:membrane protein [Streptomyces nodosus]|uniref:Membrane protein n=1 Tax=Streptomyces nodosus TaxID=40318 RepID=A0A0B5DMY2_9ACTN|nr:membrane protein [Streptomyces nodosus]